jgi:HPt (histidine-containing phosphotransfer) domain-containing protein
MNEVVSKPLDLSGLLQVLAKHLGRPVSDPAPALQPASAVAGIAYREGLRRCIWKADLYRRIAGRFLGCRPSAATCIAQHLDAGRRNDASRVAHTLISSAASLGALRLSELAQQLNQSLDAEDEATARVLLDELTHEETTVTRELQGLLAQVMPG